MPDSPEIETARVTGDPLDWAMAWQATVTASPEILTKDDLVGWMTGWFANAGQSMVNRYADRHTAPNHVELHDDEPENVFARAETIEEVIYQLVGAGSVCWESMTGTGIFDDERARRYASDACKRLEQFGVETVPAGATPMGVPVTG